LCNPIIKEEDMAFGDEGRFYPVPDNLGFAPKYAGRLDVLAAIQGEWSGMVFDGIYVGDYKTGKRPTAKAGYPEWPLQLTLYRRGVQLTEGVIADGQIVFHLDKFTGIPSVYDYTEAHEQDLETALKLVDFYHGFKFDMIQKKGGDVPSVTTILKVLDKPALPQWAANCARDYVLDEICSRNTLGPLARTKAGYVALSTVEGWAIDAAKNFRKVSGTAMDVGTRVHELIETYLTRDKEPSKSQLFDPQVKAGWDGFMEMWTSLKTEVIKTEARIFG
jgi:hypothetical protein